MNTDTQMTSKTISLREETYHRLVERKGPDESFSDVIDRLIRGRNEAHPLHDLVGAASDEEIATIKSRAERFRANLDDELAPDDR